MADNFDMKQFLTENKLGPYSRLKEDLGKDIEDTQAEKDMDFLAEREVIYVTQGGKCYRKDDEGNMDEVSMSYCRRYAEGKEEKVEEVKQNTYMIIDRIEEIVNNLTSNISTNSNIPTQEKVGLMQALEELKEYVEDLGADIEQEDEYVSDYSRRRASGLNEMLSSKTMNWMDGMVPQVPLKAFIGGAQAIIRDFKQESFEEDDIFDYLVSKIKTLG